MFLSHSLTLPEILPETPEKLTDSESGDHIERKVRHRVVPTGEHDAFMGKIMSFELLERDTGQVEREAEVISSRQHQHFWPIVGESVDEGVGADRRPDPAEIIERQPSLLEGFSDVLSRQAVPDDIGEVA